MIYAFVAAFEFVICILAWHFVSKVKFYEIAILYLAGLVFLSMCLDTYRHELTTDQSIRTGFVVSLIHRSARQYASEGQMMREPGFYAVESSLEKPKNVFHGHMRYTDQIDIMETCDGKCETFYPSHYADVKARADRDPACFKLVSKKTFEETKVGDAFSFWQSYFNPIKNAKNVFYATDNKIPYFQIKNFVAQRIIAPHVTASQIKRLESLNANLNSQNVSIGLIITTDELSYEKLKYAWHQGKNNDFVVVVTSSDGKKISNVNVLTWENDNLKRKVITSLMALPLADIDLMLNRLEVVFQSGIAFTPKNFQDPGYFLLDTGLSYALFFQGLFYLFGLLILYLTERADKKSFLFFISFIWFYFIIMYGVAGTLAQILCRAT